MNPACRPRSHTRHQGRSLSEGVGSCNAEAVGRAAWPGRVLGRTMERTRRTIGSVGRLVIPFLALALPLSTTRAPGADFDPEAVVVRVGPFSSSLTDFYREFRRAAVSDTSTLTPDHAGAAKFLGRFVDELAVQTVALPDSGLLDPQRRVFLEEGVNMIYIEALRAELLPRYLGVDENVLREVYERKKTELQLAAIKVPTRAELESVQAALAGGAPFGDVAASMSKDPATRDRRGELGWIQPTAFPVEIQRILWALPDGVDSQPVEEPNFHAIYRVLGRRPLVSIGSLDQERDGIRTATIRPILGRAGSEIHDDLMSSYHFRVDEEAAEWMRAFIQRETAQVKRGYDPATDKPAPQGPEDVEKPFWTEAPLTGADATRPIAFVDGDTLPAIEVIDQLIFAPSMTWAKFDRVSDVVDLCDEALYQRVQVMEAKRLGYGKRPEIQRKILDKKRRFLWGAYRTNKIRPPLEPTDAELRALYQQRLANYDVPEMRRFVLVNVPTLALASEVRQKLQNGKVPSSIVRDLGRPDLNFLVTPDTTAGWSVFGQHPGIDMTLFGLKKGDVSSPIADQAGYSVIRLEDLSPAHVQTFEEVRAGLRRGLVLERENKAIAYLLRQVKPTLKIWTDPAAIAAMPIDPAHFQKKTRGPLN